MKTKLFKEYIKKLEIVQPFSSRLHSSYGNINKEYAQKFKKKQEEEESLSKLSLENDLIHINKSIDAGLIPTTSGIGKDEDGKEIEVIWPDFKKYGAKEHSYFLERYNETKNIQLKVEYGLFLYISKHLQHIDDRKKLFSDIWSSIILIYNSNLNITNRYYFSGLIKNAFALCIKSKFENEIKTLVSFLQDEFLKKDIKDDGYYTLFYLILELFSQHKKTVKSLVEADKIIQKAISDAKLLEQNDELNSTESMITRLLKFKTDYQVKPSISLENYLGTLYEKIADKENENKNYMGSSHHYNKSITYFRLAKKNSEVDRIQKKYEASSGKIKLGLVKSELPEKETEDINNWINKVVEEASADQIIYLWGLYSHISSKNRIEDIENRPKSWQNLMSHSSMDKFGNTIENFITDEELKENQFWFEYSIQYKTAIQMFLPILIKKFVAKKLSKEDIIVHFEKSWLSEPIQRFYNSKLHEIIPLDIVKPGLLEFFRQFEVWLNKTESKEANFICAIDSLSLKIEPILRYMCEKLGINTTIQTKSRNNYDVIRHKTLGVLIQSLKEEGALTYEDFVYLDYTVKLPEQGNIRNDAAHGLLDSNEYDIGKAIQIISILIRLSNYKFNVKEKK